MVPAAAITASITDGKVERDTNYAPEDYEIARGVVLTCQSFPVSDKIVIDFGWEN